MTEPRTRILITDATSYKAVVVAAFIKRTRPDLFVMTADPHSYSSIFHTRHSDKHAVVRHAPRKRSRDYVLELEDIAKDNGIDLIIPVNSAEIGPLLHERERFGRALDYYGDYETFSELNEKKRLPALCAKAGVRHPRTFAPGEVCPFPAVVKPSASAAAHGVRYVSSRRMLDAVVNAYERSGRAYVIQERVEGLAAGFSVFAEKGKIVRAHSHRRLVEYPISGGSSLYRENYENERLGAYAEKLLSATGWSGFAMFEFKVAPDGEPWLIEVNPRIWGSINQALANGVDLFEPLLGPPRKLEKPPAMIRTYVGPFVHAALLRYAMRGDFEPLRTFWRNRLSNCADVNARDDIFAWIALLLRAFHLPA